MKPNIIRHTALIVILFLSGMHSICPQTVTATLDSVVPSSLQPVPYPANWTTIRQSIFGHHEGGVAYTNSLAYLIAGNDGTTLTDVVEYASINSDGLVRAWQTTSSVITPRYATAATAAHGYIYLVGGQHDTNPDFLSSVEMAAINPDGSLSAWQVTSPLTMSRDNLAVVSVGNYIYALGGTSDWVDQNTVEYATIRPDGRLGRWQATTPMNTVRKAVTVATDGQYIYAIGGGAGSLESPLASVERAAINPDGSLGEWVIQTSMSNGRVYATAVVVGAKLIVIGGYTSGGIILDSVEVAVIGENGSLGGWGPAEALLNARYGAGSMVVGNYLFLLGGVIPPGCTNYCNVTKDIDRADLVAQEQPIILPFTGTTELVSVSTAGTQGNGVSHSPSISADGRYVAFSSVASNLVSGDTNAAPDIFLHDQQTGATERVSVASDGTQANAGSFFPSISGSGRLLVFASDASNLVDGDTNDHTDVFLHDMQTGATRRISVTNNGEQGDYTSSDPVISGNGLWIAYNSYASNLIGGDAERGWDIYVYDIQTAQTMRISNGVDGARGNDLSQSPAISADGNFVVFYSKASNLVWGDSNRAGDIFIHDQLTGETERVSVASDGSQANSHSFSPSISADGRYVAFGSLASNLIAGDNNNCNDTFIHDRATGMTWRVSVASDGTQGNGASGFAPPAIAAGRWVVFLSQASNLVSEDTNDYTDIFIHDLQTGTTERVSITSYGKEGYGDSDKFSISADGRYVVFESEASNLVSDDNNGFMDIFVHDRVGRVWSPLHYYYHY